jgi:hypothetical protein
VKKDLLKMLSLTGRQKRGNSLVSMPPLLKKPKGTSSFTEARKTQRELESTQEQFLITPPINKPNKFKRDETHNLSRALKELEEAPLG